MTPFNSEMPERVARPFDLWRTTGVVSEGATIVVLEPEDSPRPGYSFISGYGFAHDEADDLCGGMAMAARQAMAAARVRPNQIEVISAWGPGHRLIDQAEFRALTNVFPRILSEIQRLGRKRARSGPGDTGGDRRTGSAVWHGATDGELGTDGPRLPAKSQQSDEGDRT